MNCDNCELLVKCYEDGRLLTFTTLDDSYIIPEIGGESHAIIGIDQICPKEK